MRALSILAAGMMLASAAHVIRNCWAPSRDKGVELFSRASVHQLSSRKTTGNESLLPPIVRGEHTDNGALLGRRCAVPFEKYHSILQVIGRYLRVLAPGSSN